MAVWGGSSHSPDAETVQCTIDGVPGRSGPIGRNETLDRWALCRSANENMAVGTHEVNVFITSSHGNAIWVDTIAYFSPPNPDLYGKYSEIPPAPDLNLQYYGKWDALSGENEPHRTNTKGSKLFVKFYGTLTTTTSRGDFAQTSFIGTSVELRGYLTANMPRKPSFATFSIDGGPEIRFNIPVYEGGFRGMGSRDTRWRVPLLITPPLPNGHHILSITYRGDSSTVPLTVDYFLVAHQGVPVTPSSNIVPGPYIDADSSDAGTGSSKFRVGAFVGGLFGGVSFLIALAFFLSWYRHRDRRVKGKEHTRLIAVPYDDITNTVYPPSRRPTPQPPSIPMVSMNRNYNRPASPTTVCTHQEYPTSRLSSEYAPSEVSSSLGLSYVSSFASSPVHPLLYPGAQSDKRARKDLETYH